MKDSAVEYTNNNDRYNYYGSKKEGKEGSSKEEGSKAPPINLGGQKNNVTCIDRTLFFYFSFSATRYLGDSKDT